MKIAHIRYTLEKALDDFKGGKASATHVLSAIEALIEEKNALQQERPSFADWTSDYVRDNLHKLKPQPAQQDIPDLIAGTLGVSRGTAYDLMREALAEQLAQPQEPDLSGLKPSTQEVIKGWIEDGTFIERAIGAMQEQEAENMRLEKALAEQPAQRTWVGLTEEEIEDAWQGLMATYIEEVDSSYWAGCDFEFARSIEAKLKEKNQ